MFARIQQEAKRLKAELYALYLAYQDPRVAWYAKLWIGVVVAYAFSPIDLIPDFIPVLGYLDDVILLPLGILIALRLIPPDVMSACRVLAKERLERDGKPVNRVAGAIIVLIWLVLALMLALWLWRLRQL